MLTVYSVLDWVSAITIASFGAMLFFTNKKPSTRASTILTLSAAAWSAGVGAFYYTDTPTLLPFLIAFNHFAGTIIAVSFYYFAYLLHSNKMPPYRTTTLIVLAELVIAFLYFGTDILAASVTFDTTDALARGWTYGPLGYPHYAYLLGFFLWGFAVMRRKFHIEEPEGEKHGHVKNVFWGSLIGFVPTLVIVVGLRALGVTHLFWLGPLFVLIWVATGSYSLVRYNVLNPKVFISEVLVLAMAITLFANIFVSESMFQIPAKVLMFGAFTIIGLLFLSNITKNEAQRLALVSLNEKLRRITDDLAASNFKLKELNEQKSYFVSFASHQLKNPLTVLEGYASMIAEGSLGKVPRKTARAAETILASSRRMARTVEDFLDVSRMELGKMEYARTPIDLAVLVEEIAGIYGPQAEKAGIDLAYKKPRYPLPILGDAEKLRHAIDNIVENAIKYTQSGSVTITADKTIDLATGIVTVTDTGIGMDAETLHELFARFRRGGGANGTAGSGLGLYLAREIVRAMGGDITATSTGRDNGSTFTISLPLEERHG